MVVRLNLAVPRACRWGLIALVVLVALMHAPNTEAGNPALGLVTIFKVESVTFQPLGGACFRITNAANQAGTGTIVCDNGLDDVDPAAGTIVYNTGTAAIYHVEETQAPPGYVLAPGEYLCDATSDFLCTVFVANDANSVGGVAELVETDAAPLEANASSGLAAGAVAAIAAFAAMAAASLGGAAWYARRRGRH